jgi:hypothetical protein
MGVITEILGAISSILVEPSISKQFAKMRDECWTFWDAIQKNETDAV